MLPVWWLPTLVCCASEHVNLLNHRLRTVPTAGVLANRVDLPALGVRDVVGLTRRAIGRFLSTLVLNTPAPTFTTLSVSSRLADPGAVGRRAVSSPIRYLLSSTKSFNSLSVSCTHAP